MNVLVRCATHEISLGDFVLTGGELPALTIIDAVGRLLPGVLGKEASLVDESFAIPTQGRAEHGSMQAGGASPAPTGLYDGILEAPQYTKPPEFRGMLVPEVLRNGDHQAIAKWRRHEALRITYQRRPDLLESVELTKEEQEFIKHLKSQVADSL